ncbi:hypothetical protein [Candidatus Nitrospira bockiana]
MNTLRTLVRTVTFLAGLAASATWPPGAALALDLTAGEPPTSRPLVDGTSEPVLGELSTGRLDVRLFHDPPSLSKGYRFSELTVVPYIGLGLGGGFTPEANHQIYRNSLFGSPAQSSLKDLSQGLVPSEVQVGVRLPF